MENFKLILKLDADYSACSEQLRLASNENEKLSAAIEGLGSAISAHKDVAEILRGENKRLYEEWLDENSKRHEAENVSQLSKWAGWLAAGAFAVSTAILSVIVTVK